MRALVLSMTCSSSPPEGSESTPDVQSRLPARLSKRSTTLVSETGAAGALNAPHRYSTI